VGLTWQRSSIAVGEACYCHLLKQALSHYAAAIGDDQDEWLETQPEDLAL
jgi:hypothetical protein